MEADIAMTHTKDGKLEEKKLFTFEKADKGSQFLVYVFDDFVIKVPKKLEKNPPEKMKRIAEAHIFLSQHLQEVLPCYFIENKLFMPRAKGTRFDLIKDKSKTDCIKKKIFKLIDDIEELGYHFPRDGEVFCKYNIFYEEETDMIYLVDMHTIEKGTKPENKKKSDLRFRK